MSMIFCIFFPLEPPTTVFYILMKYYLKKKMNFMICIEDPLQLLEIKLNLFSPKNVFSFSHLN
jgi:hypothetical protein